eukprot:2106631-Rhodomonas_salina.1
MGFDPDCVCGPCLSGSRLDQVLQQRAEAVVVRGRLEQLHSPPFRLVCISTSLHPKASILSIPFSVRQSCTQGGFCVPVLQHTELDAPVCAHHRASGRPQVGCLARAEVVLESQVLVYRRPG